MERLAQRAVERISGPAWDKVRPQVIAVHEALASAAPDVFGELTTIYVKYTSPSATKEQPFAVLWLKSSQRVVVGLALPDDYEKGDLHPPIARHTYAGLTKYFVIEPGDAVPEEFRDWVRNALRHVSSRMEQKD